MTIDTILQTTSWGAASTKINNNFSEHSTLIAANSPNIVFVTQANAAAVLGGTISSTIEYVISEIIDMTGIVINPPSTGMYLRGYNFDQSQLVSTEAGATLFSSGACGNVLMIDLGIEMSGAGSQVYDLVSNTGFDAIEVQRINYNNCTSLGTMDNFRQGLETGTGRFGGTPELTLKGVWLGGFLLATTITRSISAGSYSLFKAGVGFTMASRFRCDMNVDLPAGVSLLDFAPANFPNPNTLQLVNMIVTRAGATAPTDALYTPNIGKGDIASLWKDNVGLPNTRVGGGLAAADDVETVITTAGVAVPLNDTTWIPIFTQHFAELASNGRLRHLGDSPNEFRLFVDLIIEGSGNDELRLEIWKYDASLANDSPQYSMTRLVNNLTGGRDVAFFNFTMFITLDQNDECYLQIVNVGATSNVTVESDSTIILEAR